jgi:hypothetical protein
MAWHIGPVHAFVVSIYIIWVVVAFIIAGLVERQGGAGALDSVLILKDTGP